jgi:nucleoside-diphosphate-sugar epimerase
MKIPGGEASRALVTGGAGAIGSTLVGRLLREGWQVMVLDDLSSGYRENLPPEALFTEGSITDQPLVEELFSQRPRVVFHLAAHFANQNSVEHPRADLRVNAEGTLLLLEQALAAGVERFVYASSSCVYGKASSMKEDQVGEELDTPYAISKLAGERYARFFAHYHGVHTVSLRYFNSYGPGEFPGRYRNVIPNFFARALRKEPLVITGTGEETRDFTYVEDTAEATLRAALTPLPPGTVLNVGRGEPVSIVDLAREINHLVGNPAGVEFAPPRSWDGIPHRRAEVGRMRELLGFSPQTPLREGLEKTLQWIETRKERFLA